VEDEIDRHPERLIQVARLIAHLKREQGNAAGNEDAEKPRECLRQMPIGHVNGRVPRADAADASVEQVAIRHRANGEVERRAPCGCAEGGPRELVLVHRNQKAARGRHPIGRVTG
jgi:hypothetical protein